MGPKQKLRRRLIAPVLEFIQLEASGSILLMIATVIALVWANLPSAPAYFELLGRHVTVKFGDAGIDKPLLLWVNDGLMAIFFFLVGLEIKREVLVGHLRTVKQAALPAFAAVGGMVVPAAFYVAFNMGSESAKGWGIPMATDIAFALGVLALLGSRIPVTLKVFLTALAIVDDLGAVIVIALFYTSKVDLNALYSGFGILAVLFLVNRAGVRKSWPYVILGIALWVAFLKSGIHATIAGVLLAMTIPARVKVDEQEFLGAARQTLDEFETAKDEHDHLSEDQQEALSNLDALTKDATMPLERIESALHPWVTFFIIPVFAFANAGVNLGTGVQAAITSPAAHGILAGLVLGKPVGIVLFSLLAVKLKLAVVPKGIRTTHIVGAGVLGGIGFTMSLFIGELAFGHSESLDVAKVAILVSSVVCAAVGALILARVKSPIRKAG